MPNYTVSGVQRESKADITLSIEAETQANARAKAELQGIVVTKVSPIAPPEISQQGPKQKKEEEKLKPGESIEKGYCPRCGDVPVKTTGRGYHPGCGSIVFHIFMVIITAGGWGFVWGGWVIGCHLRKGNRTCLQCGQILQAE